MPLSETQARVVVEWLRSRLGSPICSVCSWEQFDIHSELVAGLPVGYVPDQGLSLTARAVIPAVVVVCRHCAHMQFFSASLIGISVPPTAARRGQNPRRRRGNSGHAEGPGDDGRPAEGGPPNPGPS